MRAWRGGWYWVRPGRVREDRPAGGMGPARRGAGGRLSLDAGTTTRPGSAPRGGPLDLAAPGTAERVAPLLGPPAPSSFQGLVTALINDLAADEIVLVLDDHHVIGSPQVHESLAFLIEHNGRPDGVALASRNDPPLPLARLRATRRADGDTRGPFCSSRPRRSAELLQHAAPAPDASVAALAARTEGWAAGLQLAALSRAGTTMPPLSWPPSQEKPVRLDDLAEEVLEGQDEQLRTFLLETVLERLRPVARRRHRPPGQPGTARAGGTGGPVPDPWMRCAAGGAITTCSPACSAPACRQQPGRAAQLHRNAAGVPARAGRRRHRPRGRRRGDVWAARIIEQHFDLVYSTRGEAATIHRWLSVLPAEVIRSRRRLLLTQALMAATSGRRARGTAP